MHQQNISLILDQKQILLLLLLASMSPLSTALTHVTYKQYVFQHQCWFSFSWYILEKIIRIKRM